jgi:hypothetical protein
MRESIEEDMLLLESRNSKLQKEMAINNGSSDDSEEDS